MSKAKATPTYTSDCPKRGKCVSAKWCPEMKQMYCVQWEKKDGNRNRRR